MIDSILFWHRRDLRISDNFGLARAFDRSSKIVGVFCLDPNILQGNDVAPARVAYMIGCLQELQSAYRFAGSDLLVLQGKPERIIPQLARHLDVTAVYWNRDVEPYAQQRDRAVSNALKEQGIEIQTFWDQLLHPPGEVLTGSSTIKPYTVYTPFWKNWIRQPKASPVKTPNHLQGLTEDERAAAETVGEIALPSAKDLGFVWDRPFVLEPGEDAALARLETFCDRTLFDYQEQRHFPSLDGTSCLSPALKFGAIGIRRVWQAGENTWERCRSDEARDSVYTWQQELAWREFYQTVMYFFPELADGPYRNPWLNFPWDNDENFFQAWREGRTGYPIVDAAMRQLNETGWMHNRCRMIVASFLAKDLIINWQWGEQYFMQKLIDGDLSSNNGGWQWSASSGMDPKPLRIFNPVSQSKKYDPEADYIRRWLPELSSLDTKDLVTNDILPADRAVCNYPEPIVDRSVQQRKFKALYAEQKTLYGNGRVQ
ncbi:MAG: deoxyribodipyrimidine photo-lyase [Cyanobacteria bacterium SID2]|nr:deoxyribodipyrimidine photo-lyase [Cyanobacteria bacterium SID2]MBP0005473.1 deoxyribodipyrimidine photo-lyase [Cyanobacteria bacterium SBC]